MRFSLIDRITSLESGKSIAAVKNVTLAEEYLADHFPGFAVMPGVLMLESLVQAGAWLMRHTEGFEYSTILLKQARAVKFNKFVQPGGTLHVELTVHKWDGADCTLKATSSVDGESAVSGRLTLERFNLRDRRPEMASADERQIALYREQFKQLWTGDGPEKGSDPFSGLRQ